MKKLFDTLNNFLEKEYLRLDLFYYISFIYAIIFYFKIYSYISFNKLVFFLIILSLILLKLKSQLVCRFFLSILITFIASYLICKINLQNIIIPVFPDNSIVNIQGIIEHKRNTNRGAELIIKINKINATFYLKKVKLNIANKFNINLRLGQEIYFTAKLFNISQNILPRSYDFTLFAYMSNIHATGYVMSNIVVLNENNNQNKFINSIRQTIYSKLIKNAGPQIGEFIAAFLIGNIGYLDKSLLQEVRNAGISHILCISGLHLSLVNMIIFNSSRILLNLSNFIVYRMNVKIVAAIISLIGSYFYLLLSGIQIAATRAFIMSTFFIISIIINRNVSLLRVLGVAAIIILIFHPEYVFHPSFQLSFSAVLSLIVGFEIYHSNKTFLIKSTGLFNRIKFYLFCNIYSSFLASILTAPIIFSHFYVFSTYTLINNLVAVPLMSFCLMPMAIFSIFLMLFNSEKYIIKLLSLLIEYLLKIISYSNTLPHSLYYVGNVSNLNITIFLFSFFWFCIWQNKIRFIGIIIMIISLLSMLKKTKCDFIFDYSIFALGIKSENNVLKIYTNNLSHFKLKFWANWYGQDKAQVLSLKERYFKNNHGKTLSINYYPEDKCIAADIQINIGKNCLAQELAISQSMLALTPLIIINCDKKKCHIEANKNIWSKKIGP